jgi:predicted MFS family arabinose efflux permease
MRGAVFWIVMAQFLGTSSWFSGNVAAAELAREWSLSATGRGLLLTSVQMGFIVGTLLIGLSGLADRFSASRFFTASAVLASLANLGFATASDGIVLGAAFRFFTGVSLAGIYPLGMKLIVGWAPHQKGSALGWLVGALTLGTASPHLLQTVGQSWSWQGVVLASSALTLAAAVIVGCLGDGPTPPRPAPIHWGRILDAFRTPKFRASAFGYFGHMWELYAFWFLVPQFIEHVGINHPSAWSFAVMACGAIGCVVGGFFSRRISSPSVAAASLAISGICCLLFPLTASWPTSARIVLLASWGLTVVADSPQFSAISAQVCPPSSIGAALATQNGIGFALTALSIQTVAAWSDVTSASWILLPGPVLGLLAMRPLFRQNGLTLAPN